MTKNELMTTAKALRGKIERQRTKLETAVGNKYLPPSVSEFGFLAHLEAYDSQDKAKNILRSSLGKMKKGELEKTVRKLKQLTELDTFNISGYKSRLEELRQASIDTATAYGIPSEDAQRWNRNQWANFWRVVDLINETYALPSDTAISVVGDMVASGMTIGDIMKRYVKTTKNKKETTKKYDLRKRFSDEIDISKYQK